MTESITIATAFIAGVLSIFSPCVLPLVPIYFGYLFGDEDSSKSFKTAAIVKTIFFVLGFSLVFVLLGALVGFFGIYVFVEAPWITIVAGIIVMMFGISMIINAFNAKIKTSVGRLEFLQSLGDKWAYRASSMNRLSYAKTFFIGSALGIAWTPCVGSVLAGILILAHSSQTALQGAGMLAVYSIGLGIPFIAGALFLQKTKGLIRKLNTPRGMFWTKTLSGFLLLFIGIFIATNNLILFNAWFYKIWSF